MSENHSIKAFRKKNQETWRSRIKNLVEQNKDYFEFMVCFQIKEIKSLSKYSLSSWMVYCFIF